MILRDTITKVTLDQESDGMGGYTTKNQTYTEIECKASLNTNPEVATAYGPSGEQVIYITTRQLLDKEAFYLFKGKKFVVRFQYDNNRLFFSTLVEVKKGV